MLELWKPIKPLNDKSRPLIFNELGQSYGGNKSYRPFIIFYDDIDDSYYYIKAQDKFYKDGRVKQIRKGEIEIKQTISSEGLFTKDSYVDCSQIFKCDRELLESLVDKEDKLYLSTFKLPENDIMRLKETILDCIFAVPPYLSIVEVKLDELNQTFGESLYLCDEKFDEVLNKIHSDYYDDDNIHDINDLVSSKDAKFSFQRARFNNGINFCEMFLNEYFPNLLEEFKNVQELDNNEQQNSGQKR